MTSFILRVLIAALGLWLATGGMGVRPFVITLPRPDADLPLERRAERRAVTPDRRVAARP